MTDPPDLSKTIIRVREKYKHSRDQIEKELLLDVLILLRELERLRRSEKLKDTIC